LAGSARASGAPPVAFRSAGYWQREYGGDPGVIGRTLMLNEQPVEIVGVIEPLAELPEQVPPDLMPDVWLPLQLNLSGQFWNSHMEFRTDRKSTRLNSSHVKIA